MDGRHDDPDTVAAGARRFGAPRFVQSAQRHVRRRMLAGLLVLIPLVVTVVVLRFAFVFLDNLFRPFIRTTPADFLDFPGVGVTALVLALYMVGALVAWEAGRTAIDWQSAILSRIPIVKNVYVVAKQATDALSSPMDKDFSRVVFIEWPRPGVKALGLVTGYTTAPDGGSDILVGVYIPTVPNPTSGMLAFVSPEDVIDTNIGVEDAMKMVFSGGIVLPDMASLPAGVEPSDPRAGLPGQSGS